MITNAAREAATEPEPEVVGERPKPGAVGELGPNGGPSVASGSAFCAGAAIYMSGAPVSSIVSLV